MDKKLGPLVPLPSKEGLRAWLPTGSLHEGRVILSYPPGSGYGSVKSIVITFFLTMLP